MRSTVPLRTAVLLAALAMPAFSGDVLSAQGLDDEPLVSIRLDRDPGALRRGDRIRVYYNVSRDAWVAVFHVRSDGVVDLVFPQGPRDRNRVLGGRDYRLLFQDSAYWTVDEPAGRGFLFVVASPEPFDWSSLDYSVGEELWRLPQDPARYRSDPPAALDTLLPDILPAWESLPYRIEALDYRVGGG